MVWVTSSLASLVLLGFVVAQVQWVSARETLANISYAWLTIGIGLLLIEGLVSAARFQLLTPTHVTYGRCVHAVAWYVLVLIGLPARLGEIAGIAIIVKYMNQRPGIATASLFFQRLFDMILLLSLLLTGLIFISPAHALVQKIASVLVLMGFIATIVYFEQIVSLLVSPLLSRRHEKWPRRILRLGLQARIFRRHHLNRRKSNSLGALTLLKWVINLLAIACIVLAVVPQLSATSAFGIGVVYNLSAVVPIQTVGGFGVSEAVLLGSFSWLGYSLAASAPIAIAIRVAMLSAPLAFWAVVVAALALRERPAEDA